MEYYLSPRYVEHLRTPIGLAPVGGPTFTPTGAGVMDGPRLDTSLTFWVRIDPATTRVREVAWRSQGVPEAVPFASALAQHLGEAQPPAREAAAIPLSQVMEWVGRLPESRHPAILLTLQALRRALAASGALGELPHDPGDRERACHCAGVDFEDLRRGAQLRQSATEIQSRTGFGTGCGTCVPALHAYLEALGVAPSAAGSAPPG